MINIIGVKEIYKNIVLLGLLDNENPHDVKSVERNFHSFLNELQPSVPRYNMCGVNIIKDRKIEDALADLYKTDSLLNDRNQSSVIGLPFSDDEIKERELFVINALNNIRLINSELYDIFQICIDSIFFRSSIDAGGGSTSNAIGVIWVNNKFHWTLQDMTELLIHELVHNLVFIDELRHLHYHNYDLLHKEENFAKSAILNTERPIDKVLHSIIVAVELILARRDYLGEPKEHYVHPSSDKLLFQALNSIKSLYNLPNYNELMTDRGKYIVSRCEELIG